MHSGRACVCRRLQPVQCPGCAASARRPVLQNVAGLPLPTLPRRDAAAPAHARPASAAMHGSPCCRGGRLRAGRPGLRASGRSVAKIPIFQANAVAVPRPWRRRRPGGPRRARTGACLKQGERDRGPASARVHCASCKNTLGHSPFAEACCCISPRPCCSRSRRPSPSRSRACPPGQASSTTPSRSLRSLSCFRPPTRSSSRGSSSSWLAPLPRCTWTWTRRSRPRPSRSPGTTPPRRRQLFARRRPGRRRTECHCCGGCDLQTTRSACSGAGVSALALALGPPRRALVTCATHRFNSIMRTQGPAQVSPSIGG
mmetsp:Transcript_25099/g.94864  ORF Transcript_25099/g.94864 Transcript_25099/m.94864 type:complete len:314 (+) Transcript_25099:261-1202(+)